MSLKVRKRNDKNRKNGVMSDIDKKLLKLIFSSVTFGFILARLLECIFFFYIVDMHQIQTLNQQPQNPHKRKTA